MKICNYLCVFFCVYLLVLKIFLDHITIQMYKSAHSNSVLMAFQQQRFRQACSYAQTRQCIYCSHTKCMCICRLIPKFRPLSSLETSAWCTASQRFFRIITHPNIYREIIYFNLENGYILHPYLYESPFFFLF